MDISKMYCRVDSEHFDEFAKLVGEQFGRKASNKAVGFTKSHHDCVVIGADRHHHDFGVSWCHIDDWYENKGFMEFTGSWSVYSNTKPLSELTDQQAAELFNWRRNGGHLEVELHGSWRDKKLNSKILNLEGIYRAKQKSERDLFIEKWGELIDYNPNLDAVRVDDIRAVIGVMFDAEFKAPKRGE